jgi:transcription termination/antitermination protein NusG
MPWEKGPAWYVIHTRSKFENVVYQGLIRKNKDVFLPTVRKRSRRQDRRVFLRQPLFPGYLFVRIAVTPIERLDVLKTAGVVNLIGNRDVPVPVEPEVIESLRIIVQTDELVEAVNCLRQGDPVRVMAGPFAGVIGLFVQYQNAERVVVNIEAMGRAAAIHVAAEDVEPLSLKIL